MGGAAGSGAGAGAKGLRVMHPVFAVVVNQAGPQDQAVSANERTLAHVQASARILRPHTAARHISMAQGRLQVGTMLGRYACSRVMRACLQPQVPSEPLQGLVHHAWSHNYRATLTGLRHSLSTEQQTASAAT